MPHAAGLYHEIHGPADAPPVIFSPGLGGSGTYWAPQIDAFARNHRIILYDHRGTGRSDRALPDASVEAMADDIIALMDALGIAGASIVGHAAGGIAGLALALKAPERLDRLVAVNSWASADPHFLRCFETRLSLLRNSGVEAYVAAQPLFLYPAPWISANMARLDAEAAHHIAGFPGQETVERRIAALAAFDIEARLAEIATPVLVLSSEDDMLVPWTAGERLAAGLPNARLERTSHGGHACTVTQPEKFNAIALSFLRDHAAA